MKYRVWVPVYSSVLVEVEVDKSLSPTEVFELALDKARDSDLSTLPADDWIVDDDKPLDFEYAVD